MQELLEELRAKNLGANIGFRPDKKPMFSVAIFSLGRISAYACKQGESPEICLKACLEELARPRELSLDIDLTQLLTDLNLTQD